MFLDSFPDATRKHLVHPHKLLREIVPVFLELLATSICRSFFWFFCARIL